MTRSVDHAATKQYSCLVPRRLSRCARKGRREGDNGRDVCTLPMVPCGVSPVTGFALASAMRKTKRLRRRLAILTLTSSIGTNMPPRSALVLVTYRPFYRYGGHIELIRFKEYYRMPRGHKHISFVFSSAFWDSFSLTFLTIRL